jgi:hypothetical protein
MSERELIACGLWILLVLFLLRVAGQLLVLVWQPRWLPPMKDWYSGLIPYGILLPVQIAILALMTRMALDIGRNEGLFAAQRQRVGLGVLIFAIIYALSMVVRLAIRLRRHPTLRWYEGGMIPTIFHFVLAGFLFLFAWWNLT